MLDARLAASSELSGVLNKALRARKAIQARAGLTESASMQAAATECRAIADPLAMWLETSTVERPDACVSKQALLAAYNAAGNWEGRPAKTATALGRALGRLRPGLESAQRTVDGRLQWVWVGLELLEP